MLTNENILNALKKVDGPKFHKSIVDLNMARNIQVDGTDISLDVILTIQGCSLKAKIQQDIEQALKEIGASSISIKFGSMTQNERHSSTSSLKSQSAIDKDMPKTFLLNSDIKFIAVTSDKSGVGKSTVTNSLAVALARLGKKVGILDADNYGFSFRTMLNIDQRPTIIDQTVIPDASDDVKIMSTGFFTKYNQPVIWSGSMLNKWIRDFLVNTVWGELDYLLLDLPPSTGKVTIDVVAMIPQAHEIIVTTPQNAASHVASRAVLMAQHTKHTILGVVENMAYFENLNGEKNYLFGQGDAEKLADELHTNVIAQIPFAQPDEKTGSSGFDENSIIGEVFTHLAKDIIYQ
ncbi:P-loop NTPase [Rummeliibacillus sp. NPDC094406]|uniref:P-loop NTPase n=1 Tax=Rummeliibacillus sp. NPDC094406 TaxID=3364511 RepID=UPI0038162804